MAGEVEARMQQCYCLSSTLYSLYTGSALTHPVSFQPSVVHMQQMAKMSVSSEISAEALVQWRHGAGTGT
jgi:hypothetical protein